MGKIDRVNPRPNIAPEVVGISRFAGAAGPAIGFRLSVGKAGVDVENQFGFYHGKIRKQQQPHSPIKPGFDCNLPESGYSDAVNVWLPL